MELQKETKSFTNNKGELAFYERYYVEVYGRKVYLKVVNDSDKSLLKVGFND